MDKETEMTEKHVVTMTGKKINMRCGQCQSNDIVVDAWAHWNVETQDFELHSVFDEAFCLACNEACDVDEYYVDDTITNSPASVGEFSEGCAGYPAPEPASTTFTLHQDWNGLGAGAKLTDEERQAFDKRRDATINEILKKADI